jgi:hypothetical protein
MKDYNFFADYQKKRGINIDLKSPYFIGAIMLIIVGALSIGLVVRNVVLTNQIASANMDIQTIQAMPEYLEANALKESIDSMNTYDQNAQGILDKFNQSNVITTDFIKAVNAKVPSTAKMSMMTINNTTATFTFIIPTQKTAAELVQSLRNSGLFEDIDLKSITPGPAGVGSSAEIAAIMKAGEAK